MVRILLGAIAIFNVGLVAAWCGPGWQALGATLVAVAVARYPRSGSYPLVALAILTIYLGESR